MIITTGVLIQNRKENKLGFIVSLGYYIRMRKTDIK